MKLLGRKSLKALFSNGTKPNAEAFNHLIDSTINVVSDKYPTNTEDGFHVTPKEGSNTYLSFYEDEENLTNNKVAWSIENQSKKGTAKSGERGLAFNNPAIDSSVLFLSKDGNVGIHNDNPQSTLDVKGSFEVGNSIMNYPYTEISENGESSISVGRSWLTLISGLNTNAIFHISARVDDEDKYRYAILEARAKILKVHQPKWWKKLLSLISKVPLLGHAIDWILTELFMIHFLDATVHSQQIRTNTSGLKLKWFPNEDGTRDLKIKARGWFSADLPTEVTMTRIFKDEQ